MTGESASGPSPESAAANPRRPRAPRPPRTAPPPTPWARLREHKVLQWSVAYLGAALALAHGQELLAHAFHWPESIGRLLMGVLIVGFPIAIVLAWYHGHRGMKHISAGEMSALAALLFAGGIGLTLLARSEHYSARPRAIAAPPARVCHARIRLWCGVRPRLRRPGYTPGAIHPMRRSGYSSSSRPAIPKCLQP